MHFYTSINNAYLPKARILAKSIKNFCPSSHFTLVLCDEIVQDRKDDYTLFDEVLTISQLRIPVANLELWIYMHSTVELCTAVKGAALVYFLERENEPVVYLDPDIVVFNQLTELESLLQTYDVILTPHVTIPEVTHQDIENNEICALQHGVYNYGFYAVRNSENGLKYAHWWSNRLLDYCYDDIPRGLFTDQKWGDLVPALFENVHIWKHPGCNVSTWNLSHRQVEQGDDASYWVNGQPLLFYHFSGLDSGSQKMMLDAYVKKGSCLYGLRDWYIVQMENEGQAVYGKLLSVYSKYTNSEPIMAMHRKVMRQRPDIQVEFRDKNPFDATNKDSYLCWIKKNMPIEGIVLDSSQKAEFLLLYQSKLWSVFTLFRRIKTKLLSKKHL